MKTRNAAVEGRFYPSTKHRIVEQIRDLELMGFYGDVELLPEKIYGAILPHAGHIYSGHQTIPFFRLIKKLKIFPETFIIVHPNHTGLGAPVAIDDADAWQNSLGKVALDREFALALDLPFDPQAHSSEHSAEVIIPFMQYYLPQDSFSIIPICMLDQSASKAADIAERIGKAIHITGRKCMVLASCDFSHFLAPDEGMKKDQLVIDEILSKNPSGIEEVVRKHHVSACGYGPIMVLMEYAGRQNEAYKIEILARGHSGQVVQSRDVVDYISMLMFQ